MNADRFGIRRPARAALTWSLGLLMGGAELAQADGSYKIQASTGTYYNSNVFEIPDSQALPPGVDHRGDVIQDYSLGGDIKYGDSALSASLEGKATHYTYDRIGRLTHNEESAAGKVHWKPDEVIDFQAQYTFARVMAPFAETLTTQLSLDTTKTAAATLGLYLTPVWRLDLSPFSNDAQTPLLGLPVGTQLVNFPDFRLRETGGTATINYLGVSHLTAGLAGTFTDGSFSHIVDATKYKQYTGDLVVKYNIDTMSNLSATLGYTVRDTVANPAGNLPGSELNLTTTDQTMILDDFQGDIGRTGGVTGNLTYGRTLTPKTSIDINAFRLVESYPGAANGLLATGVGATVHWKPDFKFDISLNGSFEQDDFTGQFAVGGGSADRTDHLYSTALKINYLAFKWLTLTGHLDYSDRTSNLALAGYDGLEIGLDLTATLER